MPLPEDSAVHPLVRKAAAWTWRLLVLAAGLLALLWALKHLAVIVVPIALALLLTALLQPSVDWLDSHGLPRGAAVLLLLVAGLAAIGGLLAFVISRFVAGVPQLVNQLTVSIDQMRDWLTAGPLGLSRDQIDNIGDQAIAALRDNQSRLTNGVVSTATTLTEVVVGIFVVLFSVIFLLHNGREIYTFLTRAFPMSVRERVRAAGRAGFGALSDYMRGAFVVAFVDASGIGVGLLAMGIPLALPLASLVFLGAFIPFVGAVLTGALAVLVALMAKGLLYAALTLAVVVAVQQLEGHVLQPLVMGRAVAIHPLAVIAGVSAGWVIAGIPGALLAVPTIAFLNRAVRSLLDRTATGAFTSPSPPSPE